MKYNHLLQETATPAVFITKRYLSFAFLLWLRALHLANIHAIPFFFLLRYNRSITLCTFKVYDVLI